MTSLREFQAELERLHQQSETKRRQDKREALETIRALIAEWNIQPEELGIEVEREPVSLSAPRYRDPLSGATWSGRGRPPRWLQDQERSRFEIKRR